MNNYLNKLELNEIVIYNNQECKVVYFHKGWLINLQRPDKFYYFGVHPNYVIKINKNGW